jgi:hypothetical protein
MKANITLKLDTDILREARILAAEGTSISALLSAKLEESYASGRDTSAVEGGPWRGCVKDFISAGHLRFHATNFVSDKFFVDTNILVYAHDHDAGAKHERARSVIEGLENPRVGGFWCGVRDLNPYGLAANGS